MKCVVNGRLLMPDGEWTGKTLVFGDRFAAIAEEAPPGAEVIDAEGGWVAPGLIDLHCHGFLGMDASRGDPEEIARMSEIKLRQGVTAWLPTTMTLPWPRLEACFRAVRRAQADNAAADWPGARVLGCHAEGPFISAAKKGAQDGASIQRPDIEKLRPWVDVVRLMTVAPEVDGALDFIRAARALGTRISMGHTAATAEQALEGIGAGVTQATHTFNGMPPLHHREPGAAGAALTDDRVYCELIADTYHVHPMLFGLMARLKPNRLVLITDSIQVAGLPDGMHDQMGVKVVVEGGRCRFPDGTFAGSALTLDAAVRNFRRHTGLPLWQVVNMASLHPARAIGADGELGSLTPDHLADFIITDPDFHVREVYVGGRRRL